MIMNNIERYILNQLRLNYKEQSSKDYLHTSDELRQLEEQDKVLYKALELLENKDPLTLRLLELHQEQHAKWLHNITDFFEREDRRVNIFKEFKEMEELEKQDKLNAMQYKLESASNLLSIWQEFIQEELLNPDESQEVYSCFGRRAKERNTLTEQALSIIDAISKDLKDIGPGANKDAN